MNSSWRQEPNGSLNPIWFKYRCCVNTFKFSMVLEETNLSNISGTKDNYWFESIGGWASIGCIFFIGIGALWLHHCMEREYHRRLQAELERLEAIHRMEHENMINELIALLHEPTDVNGGYNLYGHGGDPNYID